jgi:5-methylcytosine-specific restriction endonuclease McrA
MRNRSEARNCLLLNADLRPLRIIPWQKAIVWSIKYDQDSDYGIEIIQYHKNKKILGACGKEYKLPSVAKCISFLNLYNKRITFSKDNIFIRDNYTCQYCGLKLPASQLTRDHVVPRSRIKNKTDIILTDWSNIVTSCVICNAKKRDRTPQEANMKILTKPTRPTFSEKYLPLYRHLSIIEMDWLPYLGKVIPNENQSTGFYSPTEN